MYHKLSNKMKIMFKYNMNGMFSLYLLIFQGF